MFKPMITSEASVDLVKHWENPRLQFLRAEVQVYDEGQNPLLNLFYTNLDFPDRHPMQICMPIHSVVEMLRFAMTTINGGREVSNV